MPFGEHKNRVKALCPRSCYPGLLLCGSQALHCEREVGLPVRDQGFEPNTTMSCQTRKCWAVGNQQELSPALCVTRVTTCTSHLSLLCAQVCVSFWSAVRIKLNCGNGRFRTRTGRKSCAGAAASTLPGHLCADLPPWHVEGVHSSLRGYMPWWKQRAAPGGLKARPPAVLYSLLPFTGLDLYRTDTGGKKSHVQGFMTVL